MAPSPIAIGRRPETEADADFLFRLFCDSRPPMEDLLELDADLRAQLLRHQFAGQAMSYRLMHPAAAFDIIERGEMPVGRIVVEPAADAITLVDIALLRTWRGRGIGTRLLAEVMVRAREAGAPVRLRVSPANAAARRLYERLGFVAVAGSEIDVAMEWPQRPR